MKPLTIKEIQETSTEILVYIDNICRQNNIEYSIYYGSLIGVERGTKDTSLGMMTWILS